MAKRTLVRVPQGTVLSETMLANLNKIFQQEFDIEYYLEAPDLQRSYLRRRDNLHEAFKFIMKAVPANINANDINKYLDWCKDQTALPANLSIEEYQDSLSRYTAFLVDALVDCWPFSTEDTARNHEAIELLNKAEQYVIMQTGRPDLATLGRVSALKDGQFVMQWEKQLSPCLPETMQELKLIKDSPIQITPKWFRELPFYQQIFLQESEAHRKSASLLKTDLNTLQLKWKDIKSNHSSTLYHDFTSIAEIKKPFPKWFTDLPATHKSLMEYLIVSQSYPADIDARFKEITNMLTRLDVNALAEVESLRKLPQWFTVLSDNEQRLLKASLQSKDNIEDAVSFIPSRLRTIPCMANFAEHHLLVTSENGEVLHHIDPRLRASHISSRDVKQKPSRIGELHTKRNLTRLQQCAGEKDLTIQTLISPVKALNNFIPDGYLYTQLSKGVGQLREDNPDWVAYLTNHPFNIAKRLIPTWTGDVECNALLNGSEKYLLQKFVKQNLPDADFWAVTISESISFTRENSEVKGYASLLQILQKNPLACSDISLDRLKELVKMAFIVAGNQTRTNAEPLVMFSGDNEELLKHRLTDLFRAHYAEFSSWKGWQAVLANYYHACTRDNAADILNTTIKLCDLTQISCQYRDLLGSGYGTGWIFDYNGRELWLSSLENLQIILRDAISFGSCVSGKDRKALELIHTDAMLLYYIAYGSWPSINDTGVARANFVELVAELYVTRHPHEHADQNAPGANGIKTPAKYFPEDISAAICKKRGARALEIDDIMATNNEVDRIGNAKYLLKPIYASCLIAVLKLGDDSQQKLWNILKEIFKDGTYWDEKKSWSPKIWNPSPQAIGQIKSGLDTENEALAVSIANIYHAISQRPEKSYWRATETQELYQCIRSLHNATAPESLIEDVLKKLGGISSNVLANSNTCQTG